MGTDNVVASLDVRFNDFFCDFICFGLGLGLGLATLKLL